MAFAFLQLFFMASPSQKKNIERSMEQIKKGEIKIVQRVNGVRHREAIKRHRVP